ncbi:unnamed protein product [Heterobilharzia americana]|nr:unnamed protein product [Heterobilharzia americana]
MLMMAMIIRIVFLSNTCNSKSDIHIQTNKPDDNFHHPPIINMFAQLFPRLFRQDGSSSSCVSNGFFLRMQRLSATTARRVKRKKRHNRKFNRLTSQVSVEEHEEKFSLLPLYTKRRLSGLTHQENDKLLEKEGEVTIGAVVTNVSNRSSNAELWKNDLFSTPTVNSQTWPTDSPNSKMANEVARLYQGLIETIESDKLIKSRYHTWSYCSGGKAHHPNRDYLPSFGRNSVIQLRKTSKACQCSTLKNLTASGDSTDHSEVTDKTPLYNGKASGEVENVTDSPQSYHEKNSSVKSRLFPNEAAKDSENSPTENPKLENKTEETDHYTRSSANGYAKYPYVKYVAAMIDALSERLMGKISEDDLELRFQTLEAEASEAAKHNIQSNKRERFLSVSNEAEILQYHNSVQNTHRNSSPEENVNNRVKNKKLGNKRCRSISCFRVTSRQSDSDDSSPLESSPHSLKHCCLAQVKRLQLRNKLVITTNLLNRLGNHTNYPSFEADVLKLLGRQPSWHRIAILYYLTRCVGSVSSSGSSVLHQSLVVNSDSDETDDHHLYVAGSHHILRGSSELSQCSLDPLNPLYDTVVTETCRCRANVGRMKEYTITFFTRWYADWVYQRGGWQSVIDETEDSEID